MRYSGKLPLGAGFIRASTTQCSRSKSTFIPLDNFSKWFEAAGEAWYTGRNASYAMGDCVLSRPAFFQGAIVHVIRLS